MKFKIERIVAGNNNVWIHGQYPNTHLPFCLYVQDTGIYGWKFLGNFHSKESAKDFAKNYQSGDYYEEFTL